MRFADLGAATVGAYGTPVELADPVPALRQGLHALGVGRDDEAVAPGMHDAPAPLAATVEALT
jgi:hypothetical protein